MKHSNFILCIVGLCTVILSNFLMPVIAVCVINLGIMLLIVPQLNAQSAGKGKVVFIASIVLAAGVFLSPMIFGYSSFGIVSLATFAAAVAVNIFLAVFSMVRFDYDAFTALRRLTLGVGCSVASVFLRNNYGINQIFYQGGNLDSQEEKIVLISLAIALLGILQIIVQSVKIVRLSSEH